MNFSMFVRFLTFCYIAVNSTVAFAHPGHGIGGVLHGFFHPISGLDHFLTALAIGVWAAETGKKGLLLFPATFIAASIFGGILGFNGYVLPFQEMGILMSIAFLGFALLTSVKLYTYIAIPIIASFGIFHGNAHGSEIIQGVSAINYCIGFTLATAFLHLSGTFCVGFLRKYLRSSNALFVIRAFGSAILLSAVFICLGIL
ncbi:MAG: HupE/UreJ family protein [Bdellovibrionia bacterium]